MKAAILTNAAGGINTSYSQGALVVLSDHINLQGSNPLIGPNDERFGPRFPDMSRVYWKAYRKVALEEAQKLGINVAEGVYLAVTGPSYETPAEIRAFRTLGRRRRRHVHGLGGDRRVAHGNAVLAISCVTNMAAGILDQPLESSGSTRNRRARKGRIHVVATGRTAAHRRRCETEDDVKQK